MNTRGRAIDTDDLDSDSAREPDVNAAVIVALGSNLTWRGLAPAATLEAALRRLSAHGVLVVKRSRWWRSAAWPDPSHPPFVNGAAWVICEASPGELLGRLHAVEQEFGRVRAARDAPRVLDLDLIACARLTETDAGVQIPHPRAAQRAFVMGPICDLDPRWSHPVDGWSAAALFARATVGRDARPL